jgi:hypothetical protein
VLTGIGWLSLASVDRWRQGRSRSLEAEIQAGLSKISTAMRLLRKWGERSGLHPSETVYVARTRDRRRLQFSVSGDPAIERAYRTHWVSPVLSELKRQRLAERQAQPPGLVVIQAINPWTCAACGETGALLIMEGDGPLCMTCAGLGDLVFLPAGAAALTRRAKLASTKSAVVVRFSRARKRYKRQGLLVEEEALLRAQEECRQDEDVRGRRARMERSPDQARTSSSSQGSARR